MTAPIKASVKTEATQANVKGATKAMPKRVKIAGNAMILTSKLKFATIQKMEKYDRDALCLHEMQGDELVETFRISTGKASSISQFGITFLEANKEGYAIATILLPENTTDKRGFVKDNFATAIFKLDVVEDMVTTACKTLENAFAALDEEIEEE